MVSQGTQDIVTIADQAGHCHGWKYNTSPELRRAHLACGSRIGPRQRARCLKSIFARTRHCLYLSLNLTAILLLAWASNFHQISKCCSADDDDPEILHEADMSRVRAGPYRQLCPISCCPSAGALVSLPLLGKERGFIFITLIAVANQKKSLV